LDEILKPLYLSDFGSCVECIKGKQPNSRKLGAERTKDVLELIHTYVCGPPHHGMDINISLRS